MYMQCRHNKSFHIYLVAVSIPECNAMSLGVRNKVHRAVKLRCTGCAMKVRKKDEQFIKQRVQNER